jgi:5-methyltetrahydrofolate--homocysteine methyltransferase
MSKKKLEDLSEAIYDGDHEATVNATEAALQEGLQPMDIIENGLIPGVQQVSDAFSANEIFLPEMLISADAMKACLAILRPLLTKEESKGIGTVVIGSVLGDVHDIGKNIVAWMLEGAGFQVIDLGVDVAPDMFAKAIVEENPQLLALSSLLTTSAHQIRMVIEHLKDKGLRNKVKVLIGGASVNQDYADKVGADGYAIDAVGGVKKAKELLGISEV